MLNRGQLSIKTTANPLTKDQEDALDDRTKTSRQTDSKESDKKEEQKLINLSEKSAKNICELSTVFPFNLFPNTVIIDMTKVTFIYNPFYATEYVKSVGISDILDVEVQTGLLWATLTVVDRRFPDQPFAIEHLDNQGALKARRIIEGLILAAREGVDLTQVDDEVLQKHLETLGRGRTG
jgi:hypothetical protein